MSDKVLVNATCMRAAAQYEQDFLPHRLGNWQVNPHLESKVSHTSCTGVCQCVGRNLVRVESNACKSSLHEQSMPFLGLLQAWMNITAANNAE